MEDNYNLAKWLANEITDQELIALEGKENFALYQKIKNKTKQGKTTNWQNKKMAQNIISSKKPNMDNKTENKTIPLKPKFTLLRIAATFFILIAIVLFFITKNNVTIKESLHANNNVTLPDGSSVKLYKNASVTYNSFLWNFSKTLKLRGTAYFSVKKGETFEVNATHGSVQVLGTQFEIIDSKKTFAVNCYEGKVLVNHRAQKNTLTKGMGTYFDGKVVKSYNRFIQKPFWLNNELDFVNANILDVVREINTRYKTKIKVSKKLHVSTYTGKLPANDYDTATKILCNTYKIKIQEYTNKNTNEKVLVLE
jgi:transmembrane sensor